MRLSHIRGYTLSTKLTMTEENSMRIALGVEYLGTAYAGWQAQQSGIPTIQAKVEAALSQVANHPVNIVCAGRTDAGVHALCQVIHADVQVERRSRAWVLGSNTHLPRDIAILWAQSVDNNFHARFSAQARRYRYVILNRPIRAALWHDRVNCIYPPLNITAMQTAGQYLLGTHDFTSFRAAGCQAKSPIRTLQHLVVEHHQQRVIIDVQANAFLHHMVRNIAGVLIKIGLGEATPEWAQQVLHARDRTVGGVTATASGLYFCGVSYPPPYQFPQSDLTTTIL